MILYVKDDLSNQVIFFFLEHVWQGTSLMDAVFDTALIQIKSFLSYLKKSKNFPIFVETCFGFSVSI